MLKFAAERINYLFTQLSCEGSLGVQAGSLSYIIT
jgi:hypothetical protein